jgi:N-acetylmuramoyl-L-alanine amidase
MTILQKIQILAAWIKQLFLTPKMATYVPKEQRVYCGEDDEASYNGCCENEPLVEVPLEFLDDCVRDMIRRMTRHVTTSIGHCSATPEGRYHTGAEVDRWHRELGKNGNGYHFVLGLTGKLYLGRPLNTVGAHAQGHNTGSIGWCYIGGMTRDMRSPKNTMTPEQILLAERLIRTLNKYIPSIKHIGHNEVSSKACPSFNMQTWLNERGLINHSGI